VSNDHESHANDDDGTDHVAGQVSEVSGMGETPDAISPSDATAGAPEAESGEAQEGEAGPDAKPAENIRSSEVDH
jgi:hypothetical protein